MAFVLQNLIVCPVSVWCCSSAKFIRIYLIPILHTRLMSASFLTNLLCSYFSFRLSVWYNLKYCNRYRIFHKLLGSRLECAVLRWMRLFCRVINKKSLVSEEGQKRLSKQNTNTIAVKSRYGENRQGYMLNDRNYASSFNRCIEYKTFTNFGNIICRTVRQTSVIVCVDRRFGLNISIGSSWHDVQQFTPLMRRRLLGWVGGHCANCFQHWRQSGK